MLPKDLPSGGHKIELPDQKEFWDSKHSLDYPNLFEPTELAFTALRLFRERGVRRILELGCGRTGDAVLFAQNGFQVVATDISPVALDAARAYSTASLAKSSCSVHYVQCDIARKLPFAAESFDAVYSRLSVHYFIDDVTTSIFKQIYAVLAPSGCLLLSVKSTEEARYNEGQQVETDVFVLNGHIRHFFSSEYMRSKLYQFKIKYVILRPIDYDAPTANNEDKSIIEAFAVKE